MLNKDFVRRKISLIEDELTRLTEFENLTLGDIAPDYRTQAIVERLLERIIGRALDINQHIIAEKGAGLKSVTKYRETFLRLAELGVYPQEFAEEIAPSAGFRNALVHDYNDIDPRILQKSIGEAIKEFNEYGKYILEYVEREETGFGLIGLIISVAVIAVLASGGLYLKETQQIKSQLQVGLEAEKKAQELRDKILQQQKQQLKAVGENLETQQSNSTDTTSPALSGVEGWKTYRNEKYGFEVKFPPRWSNAVIEEVRDTDYGGVSIMFKLLSKVVGKHQVVCYFSIYPSANWDSLQNSDEPKPVFIAKHNDTIYGYGCGHDDYGYVGFEDFNEAVDNQRFSSMPTGPYDEFKKSILPTLKFIK